MENKWIDTLINKCEPIKPENKFEENLVTLLVEVCYEHKKKHLENIGELLAAAYDLVISAEYYTLVTHNSWLYCHEGTPRLFLPYTNCCPRHAIKDEFFFHPASKPSSGKIGTASARILLLFYQTIFKYKGLEEEVIKGTEPVDAIIINRSKKKVLFAEIKASPLLTLGLCSVSEQLEQNVDDRTIAYEHEALINSSLYNNNLELFVPKLKNEKWVENYFLLGRKQNQQNIYFGFEGIINLIESDANFFREYFLYWKASLNAYSPKNTKSIFWLQNACGTPNTLPNSWQKRRTGSGMESISDSKTSVGMDRTDDIKKGIYQVLKLGAEGNINNSKWDYKVGIISNIYPERHFDEYLAAFKDIIWTNDVGGNIKLGRDIPPQQPMYNLFDGIITLTKTYSRDEWVNQLFVNL